MGLVGKVTYLKHYLQLNSKKEPPLRKMGLKVTLHLGKVSGLANPIDTYKDDDIWPPLLFSLVNITQDIHWALWCENSKKCFLHCCLHWIQEFPQSQMSEISTNLSTTETGLLLWCTKRCSKHSKLNHLEWLLKGSHRQTWTVEEIRVKEPCFFPKRLAATESHNFSAISAAFIFPPQQYAINDTYNKWLYAEVQPMDKELRIAKKM